MLKHFIVYILIFIGAGFSACSFGFKKVLSSKQIPVSKDLEGSSAIDSLVSPYKSELAMEMNDVIATAEVDFINERVNGNLGNLVSSLFLEQAEDNLNAICVINFGGLRASINKGKVTMGDAYKLLPFDNYLVIVRLPKSALSEMKDWILKSGGHPFAGFKIIEGKLKTSDNLDFPEEDFWVVTNDYLLNGGDNAIFFTKNLEVVNTNILLRDLFIEKIKGKTLQDNKEQRLILK
jgi:2',3'-cyclic-nucleotide 2'-phosphodiesterase (5'-nucleotidase family)